MSLGPKTDYVKMNYEQLQNYRDKCDNNRENIFKMQNAELKQSSNKRYDDRYQVIQKRIQDMEDIEDEKIRRGAV